MIACFTVKSRSIAI